MTDEGISGVILINDDRRPGYILLLLLHQSTLKLL